MEPQSICGLPLPRYINCKCCRSDVYLENLGDEDYTSISSTLPPPSARTAKRPHSQEQSSSIPLESFAAADSGLAGILSSAGISIWQERDPFHLTGAAYGDIAASLLKLVKSLPSEATGQHCPAEDPSRVCGRAVDPDPRGSAFIFPPGSGSGSRRVNLSTKN